MKESRTAAFRQQLESLYSISIEVSRLHEMPKVLDRALGYCLDLTQSAFGFIGLLNGSEQMDVAAIKGFEPSDPRFYEKFRLIPVRPSVFGVVITNRRSKISNEVLQDPDRVGQPPGHPPVRTFMGVPLQVGEKVIGMIGVANKLSGYTADEERLLSTFANQVAVAIENARLYEDQRRMIGELEDLHRNLSHAEREKVLRDERERIAANGLLSDLRRLVRETGKSEELEADLVVSGKPLRLGTESEQTLYVLAREALANVVRRAQDRKSTRLNSSHSSISY